MPSSSNVTQFVVATMVVAVMSRAALKMGFLGGPGPVPLTIKGFLTFFSLSLVYFPVSLMLGGIQFRNRFFERPQ